MPSNISSRASTSPSSSNDTNEYACNTRNNTNKITAARLRVIQSTPPPAPSLQPQRTSQRIACLQATRKAPVDGSPAPSPTPKAIAEEKLCTNSPGPSHVGPLDHPDDHSLGDDHVDPSLEADDVDSFGGDDNASLRDNPNDATKTSCKETIAELEYLVKVDQSNLDERILSQWHKTMRVYRAQRIQAGLRHAKHPDRLSSDHGYSTPVVFWVLFSPTPPISPPVVEAVLHKMFNSLLTRQPRYIQTKLTLLATSLDEAWQAGLNENRVSPKSRISISVSVLYMIFGSKVLHARRALDRLALIADHLKKAKPNSADKLGKAPVSMGAAPLPGPPTRLRDWVSLMIRERARRMGHTVVDVWKDKAYGRTEGVFDMRDTLVYKILRQAGIKVGAGAKVSKKEKPAANTSDQPDVAGKDEQDKLDDATEPHVQASPSDNESTEMDLETSTYHEQDDGLLFPTEDVPSIAGASAQAKGADSMTSIRVWPESRTAGEESPELGSAFLTPSQTPADGQVASSPPERLAWSPEAERGRTPAHPLHGGGRHMENSFMAFPSSEGGKPFPPTIETPPTRRRRTEFEADWDEDTAKARGADTSKRPRLDLPMPQQPSPAPSIHSVRTWTPKGDVPTSQRLESLTKDDNTSASNGNICETTRWPQKRLDEQDIQRLTNKQGPSSQLSDSVVHAMLELAIAYCPEAETYPPSRLTWEWLEKLGLEGELNQGLATSTHVHATTELSKYRVRTHPKLASLIKRMILVMHVPGQVGHWILIEPLLSERRVLVRDSLSLFTASSQHVRDVVTQFLCTHLWGKEKSASDRSEWAWETVACP